MTRPSANILVIDDEKSVCVTCKRILEEEGHHVEYVLSGEDGVRTAESGRFDLALVDLRMPDLPGEQVLERIKAARPSMPIIIITGYATIQTSIACIKKGAFDYIPKPFTPEELAHAVTQALENHRLRQENEFLKSELSRTAAEADIIGRSDTMEELRKQILKVAPTDFSVLIFGESGTGKELVAASIHQNSLRASQPFVPVDLSSLSPTLVESELFGHVKGAFTGAMRNHPGYFTLAASGTLFLDEISNISLELQGKLLRALESRTIWPVGATKGHEVDIRLICATNKDLAQMVERGEFREDLFYRINVLPINIPPLRKRMNDIPLLATHFLRLARECTTTPVQGFSTGAVAKMIAYAWPGNVRELKNIVERLVATADSELIEESDLPGAIAAGRGAMDEDEWEIPKNVDELKDIKKRIREMAYEKVEQKFILRALDGANWNVSKAALETGMQRTNFHALMRKYGVKIRERA
ncbi:MAG: sigma-54-dependent Fis family transcriptional regulator [Deltaproteobacteria bacterium]|nr:sigma-54-dependent Fis family transcriptional regulator [Deltaproteobacteria bacterium]